MNGIGVSAVTAYTAHREWHHAHRMNGTPVFDRSMRRTRARAHPYRRAHLRTLPAVIASDAINYGRHRQRREQHQLLLDCDAPWTVHAVTSSRYARVHHDELAGRVLDLMAQHTAWSLSLGYKDGVFGAEQVPSGDYLGDRDTFLFLVDGTSGGWCEG